jgi:2-keto-4-pentenoate hydratase/2-oxohepta-3-ene-1,7-dioic acid hydratase in catechol pathway
MHLRCIRHAVMCVLLQAPDQIRFLLANLILHGGMIVKILRYRIGNKQGFGVLSKDNCVLEAVGSIQKGFSPGSEVGALSDIELLCPTSPSKIIAVGRNYAAHIAEFNRETPKEPVIFLKPPSSLIGAGSSIRIPMESKRVEHEAELAIVIGKQASRVDEAEAVRAIFGYTCANDVTARDLQHTDVQWTRGKGFDTFCPAGPWIDTDFDPEDREILCRVNGTIRQNSNTRLMLFEIPFLISYISRIMTLEPGDLILTGTPDGVSQLFEGDEVEVEVEGLGVLQNPVETLA